MRQQQQKECTFHAKDMPGALLGAVFAVVTDSQGHALYSEAQRLSLRQYGLPKVPEQACGKAGLRSGSVFS